MASILQHAVKFLLKIENNLVKTIHFRYPPECFVPAIVNLPQLKESTFKTKNLPDLLRESFLWAVPKKRVSIERRRCRRFGIPGLYYKILEPKTNILICSECGHYKEAGLLCPNCYSKVAAVTKEMQETIEKNLGIAPVENEVVVLFSDDEKQNPEFFQGKRIVEMKKDRPKVFCDNLLQRSTQGPTTAGEIIPKNDFS